MRELDRTNISEEDYRKCIDIIRTEYDLSDDDVITITVSEDVGEKCDIEGKEYYRVIYYLIFSFPVHGEMRKVIDQDDDAVTRRVDELSSHARIVFSYYFNDNQYKQFNKY